jgi:hypothetical protein
MSLNPPPNAAPSLAVCKCCHSEVNPHHNLCPVCNFPLKGTEEEQNNFIYERGYKQIELGELKNKSGKAANTFYVLAGLLLLVGLVQFFKNATDDLSVSVLIVYAALCIAFICFGIWSNSKPVPAIICGLSLYVLITILDWVESPAAIVHGLIIRGIIIYGLIRALTSALNAEKIRKEHKI